MKSKFFYSVLALVLIFSACNNYLEMDQGIVDNMKSDATVATGVALSASASGPIVWYGESDRAVAVSVDDYERSERTNSGNYAGNSISSNAHSADYPGIYFRWNVQQKDVGYLKVHASVFDEYEGFILTAQESNIYWDFLITLQPGQQMTSDGCYVFKINKLIEKFAQKEYNINQVWITYLGTPPPPPPATGSLKIVKAFENVSAPAGWNAIFTVTGPDGYTLVLEYAQDFESDGTYTLDGLILGDYSVVETNPDDIAGYTFEGATYVSGDGIGRVAKDETATVTIKNEYAVIPPPTPVEVPVGITANFVETLKTITHAPVYASANGTIVSHVNINAGRSVPIPDADKKATGKTLVYDMGNGITGGYYAKPGGNDNNAFNGFTYLEINVAALRAAGSAGVNIDIATSNMSNGNLPNAGWNTKLGFDASYNLSIAGNNIIVKINDYNSCSWDAVLFTMDSKRPNNINSETKHADRESKTIAIPMVEVNNKGVKTLTPVETVWLFWHGSSITTNKITGCKVVSTVSGDVSISPDISVVITCDNASIAGNVVTFEEEGNYSVNVELKVGDVVKGTRTIPVEVTEVDRKLVASPDKIDLDFGRIVMGARPDVIICSVCQ